MNIFALFGIVCFIWTMIITILEKMTFKKGQSPDIRVCKICGQTQHKNDKLNWNELGKCLDKECRCHLFSTKFAFDDNLS